MDLNLTRVFVAIYETRNLTLAAARLFVTQSAVSQSLSRLRQELDDPLFTRVGRTMEPTQLAHHVFQPFRDATAIIDKAVGDIQGFDPLLTTRRFRIALSELGEIGWLPTIARHVNAAAPGAQLESVPLDPKALPDWLNRGVVDVAISPIDLEGEYRKRVVKRQEYCVAMSEANPLASVVLSLADYEGASRAVIVSDSGAPILKEAERQAGILTEPSVMLQHFSTLPALFISRPALIAALPLSIAEGWANRWPVVLRALPFDMSPIQIRVYRRAASQESMALEWFYDQVFRAVSTTAGRFDFVDSGRGAPVSR